MAKLDPETFSMILNTIDKLEKERLPLEKKLELDRLGEFPHELIRFMLSKEMALHLIFIPEEFGGLGAGPTEVACISERMAKMDLAVATSFLGISLGMDPLRVGATPQQKEKYITRIAEEGLIVAYGVTEPNAGSNVQALQTKAERVLDKNGQIWGYKLNGQKQFITNAGVADLYTILANTPEGPSFFIVERGTPGLNPGRHEDKHGIRASDTCPISIEDLLVPKENLIGEVEGQGLKQANQVFGYTRLMVAALGIGGGTAALERAIAYSKVRIQFGSPLSEKQGYTHKLLIPHAVRLEAARAFVQEVAKRLEETDQDLQVEGSVAKYFATETADMAANDAIQAFGGYGYMREYEVEKIKRDAKILTIYEGTSEIQRNIISIFRMRETVRSKGGFYENMAQEALQLGDELLGKELSTGFQYLNKLIMGMRKEKLTSHQYLMFLLADIMAYLEVALAMAKKAKYQTHTKPSKEFMCAASRLITREALEKLFLNSLKIGLSELDPKVILSEISLPLILKEVLVDMDRIKGELIS
jgi:alkylation response protein AidB-like acyl-CoA dehydrogenase